MKTDLYALILVVLALYGCGYKAADAEDIEARAGEMVGVLVNEKGKADPNAWIQLYAEEGTEPLQEYQGMDSDGRFGVFPPDTGIYHLVGSFGEPASSTKMVILQNIEFAAGDAKNLGKLQATGVAGLSVQVNTPDSVSNEGVAVQILGFEASTTTVGEGIGVIDRGIPPGTYNIRLSKEGLLTKTLENIVLESGNVKVVEGIEMELQ